MCRFSFSVSEKFQKIGRAQARKILGPFESVLQKNWFVDIWISQILKLRFQANKSIDLMRDCLRVAETLPKHSEKTMKRYSLFNRELKNGNSVGLTFRFFESWWDKVVILNTD